MTTFTRERLEKIANFHSQMVLPPSHAEIEELARIALATMQQVPVVYQCREIGEGDWQNCGQCVFEFCEKSPEHDSRKLYAAPPAPVVPDEIDVNDPSLDTHRKWMAEGWNRCRAAMLKNVSFRENGDSSTETLREILKTSTTPKVIPDGYLLVPVKETLDMAVAGGSAYDQWSDEYPTDVARRIWAAMLAAAPPRISESDDRQTLRHLAVILAGNDATGETMALTVTAQSFVDRCKALVAERDELRKGAGVFGSWTQCSEQMPENGDTVLVCQDGGIIFCAEVDSGCFYPDEFPNIPKEGCEITHWMPLPAPVQQEGRKCT